jgi:hypothetical protein
MFSTNLRVCVAMGMLLHSNEHLQISTVADQLSMIVTCGLIPWKAPTTRYVTVFSLFRLVQTVRIINGWWIGKDLKGSGCSLRHNSQNWAEWLWKTMKHFNQDNVYPSWDFNHASPLYKPNNFTSRTAWTVFQLRKGTALFNGMKFRIAVTGTSSNNMLQHWVNWVVNLQASSQHPWYSYNI